MGWRADHGLLARRARSPAAAPNGLIHRSSFPRFIGRTAQVAGPEAPRWKRITPWSFLKPLEPCGAGTGPRTDVGTYAARRLGTSPCPNGLTRGVNFTGFGVWHGEVRLPGYRGATGIFPSPALLCRQHPFAERADEVGVHRHAFPGEGRQGV